MIAHMTIRKKKMVSVINKYYVPYKLPAEPISHQESLSCRPFETSSSKSESYPNIR